MIWGAPPVEFGPMTQEEWNKIDPDLFENSWAYSMIKTFGMFSVFAVCILLMIYTGQEKLLYVPGQPIQFIEDNPPRYKNPEERNMKYEEIWLQSKDGTKLQGWFMYHETNTRNRDTVIFMHENAGNIGLRLDYFELIYHNLNVNVVAVAYRGYSKSGG